MREKQEPANSDRGTRKAYQPPKLVTYGHFQDVVKFVPAEGSQLQKAPPA